MNLSIKYERLDGATEPKLNKFLFQMMSLKQKAVVHMC